MRYVIARLENERREMAYRFYVADGVYAISKTAYAMTGGAGAVLTERLADILNPKPEDNRSFEEIRDRVFGKIGV